MPILGSSASQNTKSFFNPYPIGSTGPGGGKVFYDAGSILSWGRYLEAAVSTTSPSWTDSTGGWGADYVDKSTSSAIGTGLTNSNTIAAGASATCRAFTGGGKSDWFLPSKDELNQLYLQKTTVGGFNTGEYWSSTQYDYISAMTQRFADGYQVNYTKDYSSSSKRAVRYF